MANKKFDYSNDMVQGHDSQDENESKEILRHQRLEQRNNALANEFRDLKPEIGNAYNLLCNLADKTGTFANTMLNLLDLFKTALPIRFSEEDRKMFEDELNAIAQKASKNIRGNESRVSLPQMTFWCLIALLVILSMFLGLVTFANANFLHSVMLWKLIVYTVVMTIAFIAVLVWCFLKCR